jgi:hypothetical protein
MPDRDYSQRDVLDKLGVKPGQRVAFADVRRPLDGGLWERVRMRAGGSGSAGPPFDLVLLPADAATDVTAELHDWRARIDPAGCIWVLTPKRGQPGYVDQRKVIAAGLEAGLVDNKSCSVSEHVSGLRFVIRLRDRPPAG